MKTKYWITLLCVLLLLCAIPGYFLLASGEDASFAEVYSDNKLIRVVDLKIDQTLTVDTTDGYNIITVKDGKIAVTEASCPDHYCMNRGFCAGGAQIVCLPNRLVIKFTAEQAVDGVVG